MVKDYILWLKNERCIEGTVEDNNGEKLKTDYVSHKRMIKIIDTDGELIIPRKHVYAVAVNNREESKEVKGFR